MSREPLPPRPEKESSDVSEAPREPSATDGLGRRVADRAVDGTSPLRRALAGLTTAGEWAAQAEADERASAESRERDLGAEPDEVVDLETDAGADPAADLEDEPPQPSPRERARQRKAQAREARRAEKLARRAARRTARESPEVEAETETEAWPTVDEVLEAEEQQERADAAAGMAPADDVTGTSVRPGAGPRRDARARRVAAKHARRAAALERRQGRAEAKMRRSGHRDDEHDATLAEPVDVASAHEPDEIDRELAADDVVTELAAAAAEAEREEAERLEAERREAEQVELARLETERLEAERLIAEELAAERLAAEQAEVERAEAERIEAERLAAAAVVSATPDDEVTSDEPEIDWEDVERRAAEAAVAVSARAAAREQKASDRQRRIEAKAAARLAKDRARHASTDVDDVPEPPDETGGEHGTSPLTVVAAIVGAGGLILSVVLAVGAMLAALGTDSGTLYSVVSTICDALTAPLGGLVDFTGSNAVQKEALVAWGLGSIVYLAIGLGAQSLLRSRTDDD